MLYKERSRGGHGGRRAAPIQPCGGPARRAAEMAPRPLVERPVDSQVMDGHGGAGVAEHARGALPVEVYAALEQDPSDPAGALAVASPPPLVLSGHAASLIPY